jgi:hypothetical protein
MTCCGKKRAQYQPKTVIQKKTEPAETIGHHWAREEGEVYLKYTGKTRLTAVGLQTGNRYRFNAPGAIVAVDGRDLPSLGYIRLQIVKKEEREIENER